jgi:hypothetical protein
METVIMHPKNKEQLLALKAFAKTLKIDFETEKSPYNPEFVAKIKKSIEQAKQGKVITLDPNKSLWENIGVGKKTK